MKTKITVFVLFMVLSAGALISRPWRVDEIPNGSVNQCSNCHFNPEGGGSRNSFGQTVEAQFLTAPGINGDVIWGKELAEMDSDGDGFTNGQELGDPHGDWQVGMPQPGNENLVTLPGDASDFPSSVFGNDYNSKNHTLTFGNLYPNPSDGNSTLNFLLKSPEYSLITVYNSSGSYICTLFNGLLKEGQNTMKIQVQNFYGLIPDPGAYYIWINAGDASLVCKMMINQ